MKKLVLIQFLTTLCMFMSCTSIQSGKAIDYQLANGYFVRNDAPPTIPSYIDNERSFDSLFGMAPVMGESGMPTKIDFSRQSVIPIVLSPTEYSTNILPENVEQKGNNIIVNCTIVKGEKPQTYTIQPCALLVIAKPKDTPKIIIQSINKDE